MTLEAVDDFLFLGCSETCFFYRLHEPFVTRPRQIHGEKLISMVILNLQQIRHTPHPGWGVFSYVVTFFFPMPAQKNLISWHITIFCSSCFLQ
jgi:hypothetical protein